MKHIIKGKLKIRIARECPYYGTGGRTLEKVLFYSRKLHFSVSLWRCYDGMREFTDKAKKHLQKIFPGCQFDGTMVIYNGKTYFPTDSSRFLFNEKYDFEPTESDQVFFDRKSEKYIGYSHRGRQMFGIGDMLFDLKNENLDIYYQNPKYRWQYIKVLLRYHIKKDWFGFKDICEDNIIGHGIKTIVPFRERGSKRIETLEEAYKAASNFAEYVS